MTTALALAPQQQPDRPTTFELLPHAVALATQVATTEFVPRALQNRPEAVVAAILKGHELDIPPMESLAAIHIIEGRPALSAELMRGLVLRHGHELWFESTSNTTVTVCGRRAGGEHTTKVTWTLDDAKRARLDGKQNWRNYPRAMLVARATGELCRMVFADVLGGLAVREEVEDGFEFEQDVPDDVPSIAAAPTTTKRKAAPARKAAARKATSPAPIDTTGNELPPLPGEEEPTAAASPVADPDHEAASKRRQQVAMRCDDLRIDRAELIHAVSDGRYERASDLDVADLDAVLEVLRQIKTGVLILDTSGDAPALRAPEPDEAPADAPAAAPAGGEVEWDEEAWRAFITEHGVKVVPALKAARQIAADANRPVPSGLGDVNGDAQLAGLLRGWVEEQGGAA